VDGDGLFNGGFNDPKTITLNSLRSVQDNILGKILFQNTSNDVAEIYANSGPDGTNRDEGKLAFRTAEAGGTMRTRMLIDYTGDISFYEDTGTTPKMVWKSADERLGIGINSPAEKLHVSNSYTAPTGGHDGAVHAVISNSGSANNYVGLELSGGNNGGSFIHFGDTDDANVGALSYFHNGNYMRFDVNASEAMRISGGNLLVGTSDSTPHNNTGTTSGGIALTSDAYLSLGRYNGASIFANRQSTDGAIAEFRKDGATVGSIGSYAGSYLTTGTNAAGLAFIDVFTDQYVRPHNTTTNAISDGIVDLGNSAGRFKDLYLSGGVYLGGTGSSNKLDDYEEGNFTPVLNSGLTIAAINRAVYVKIGSTVHLQMDATFTGTGTSSELQLSGLPFTNVSDGWATGTGYFQYINSDYYMHATPLVKASGTILAWQINVDTSPSGTMPANHVDAGYFQVSVTYHI
jgi:hypothetical protein